MGSALLECLKEVAALLEHAHAVALKQQDALVKNDAEGVLQDVHWSSGFGYFPTYTLGTITSVQLLEAAKRSDPKLRVDLSKGKYERLLKWLRRNVHRHGAVYPVSELLMKATGSDLTTGPYLQYLNSKYRKLYDL